MTTLHRQVLEPTARASSGLTWWFLHGFMGDSRDWSAVAGRVGSPRDRSICVDLPWHGCSPPPADPVDAFEAAAEALAVTIRARPDTERPRVLVGYSLGGRLALELVARHPELVDGLVLESAAAGGLTDPAERTARVALDDARADALRADPSAFLRQWYAAPLFASLSRHPATRAAAMARRANQDPNALAAAVCAFSPGRQPGRLDVLRNVSERIPVLWLGGRLDVKYIGVGQAIAAACPAVDVQIVDDAGHSVHLERPDAFVERLESFRNRVP